MGLDEVGIGYQPGLRHENAQVLNEISESELVELVVSLWSVVGSGQSVAWQGEISAARPSDFQNHMGFQPLPITQGGSLFGLSILCGWFYQFGFVGLWLTKNHASRSMQFSFSCTPSRTMHIWAQADSSGSTKMKK